MSARAGGAARVVEPPSRGSIMAIAAHPDDIESWCAGTLARAIDLGVGGRLLLVTSGEKGTADPAADSREVAGRREDEARRAANILGIGEVAFLRYPDAEVEESRELRAELTRWIRRWRPGVVFTHDPEHPWPRYLSHRDHRVVGRAALDAIYPLARDPLSFPEQVRDGLAPHVVGAVWLFASAAADRYVDIAPTFERKVAARLAHASQTTDADALDASWRGRAGRVGAPAGLALAEAFTIVPSG